jgi:hypothetical protein
MFIIRLSVWTSALTVATVLAASIAWGQPPRPRVRVLLFRSNIPIPSRLFKNDEFVVIQRPWDVPVHSDKEDARSSIDYAASMSAMVAVVEIVSITGELTENRSWIRTRLVAMPIELLTARNGLISEGASIVVTYEGGGEMVIGRAHLSTAAILDNAENAAQVRIELERNIARLAHPLNVERGRRYLMFLEYFESTKEFVPVVMPLAVEAGVISKAGFRPTAEIELIRTLRSLYGLTLTDVMAELRRLGR